MRLGQAARKYKTSTTALVKLLADHFRTVNDHPNIKLTEEEVAFFEKKLLQSATDQETETNKIQSESTTITPAPLQAVIEKPAKTKKAKPTPAYVENLRPQIFTLENEFNEKTQGLEKFKAEKPELEGLKVLGKIELPEPKPKKEEKQRDDKRQTKRRNLKDSVGQPRKNRAAEERKKAERIAKRKKIEAEKRAKELKKKHYEEQIKVKLSPPKPKKKKKKSTAVSSTVQPATKAAQQRVKKAKGLKRFWLWLNGAYDNMD